MDSEKKRGEAMKKINYVCFWEKSKQKTWSGTCWGLYTALQKYYTIIDYNIGYNTKRLDILAANVLAKCLKKVRRQKNDLASNKMLLLNPIIKHDLKKNSDPIFLFAECPKEYSDRSYIFLDAYTGYVKDLYDNQNELLKLSNWAECDYKTILKCENIQREFLFSCKGIFTMSHWLKDSLVNKYGIPENKVTYAGGGANIDPNKIDYSMKTGNKILFVGRDFERKGGYLLLEAFKLAKQKRSDLELFIIGPSGMNVNFETGIHFVGDINSNELSYYYNLCDIFCMPSYFEAYGLVFAEALIYGLPCIARNSFEMKYFITPGINGDLIDNDDYVVLSQKILALLQDYSIMKTVRDRKEMYINEYSWNTVAERIYHIIN